ncbi:hypothetical protein CAPTEDRAFT_185039 [Capitella teleta]|uniref:Uncharacterized protein n=1 Tax=Capitella teleta TaxID=283909 RepID=R7T5C1_CAPTE|nr:hypothetical protein CAPTEDRAFT_189782 [Capitella teleta]ELT89279.1 hypothetical protein CAPTEDRAFT_185039 [Capitella teleta]|eukprot:ELT88298.1 hypothetical protein CAPTEDRAFT_189782 [Capitella teleta]
MDSSIVIAGILDYEIMLYIKGCGNDYPFFCLIEKNVSQKHQLTKVWGCLAGPGGHWVSGHYYEKAPGRRQYQGGTVGKYYEEAEDRQGDIRDQAEATNKELVDYC